MKGVILAGGTGSRLMPSTKVTNKHLLPVYDRPMIYYPLDLLGRAGIDDVLIISGEGHAGDFLELMGDGSDIPTVRKGEELDFNFEGDITYKVQREPLGISHAIGLAEDFVDPDEKFVVILGDNIFERSVAEKIEKFKKTNFESQIFLKEVEEPERFGNPKKDGERIVELVEKPDEPFNNLAVTGLYGLYNDNENSLFRALDSIEKSERGEYEVTDMLNWYLEREELTYEVVDGFWCDAGKPESLFKASSFMRRKRTGKD